MNDVKLALMSCGLGRVQRGFEVSAARWATALRESRGIDLRLFCGGPFPGATQIPSVGRNSPAARTLRRAGLIHDGCKLEQITFFLGVLPSLLRWRPDVVWLQEITLAKLLARRRRTFGLRYKIVFCDGAPVGPEDYHRFDFIQHLNPGTLEAGRKHGIDETRMQVLPHCSPLIEPQATREALRAKFGFADGDWVVLCVAAWNRHHKRIDYLIEEVAALEDPGVVLFLCGQTEAETPGLRELAARRLGGRVVWKTLPPDEIYEAMKAADVFVLPSLHEALGAVLVEAAICGLPVFTHRHDAAVYVLGDGEWTADLSVPGALTGILASIRRQPPSAEAVARLRDGVRERFTDRALAPQFASMIRRVAA